MSRPPATPPAAPPPAPATSSSSLDLGETPAPATAASLAPPDEPRRRARPETRVPAGGRVLLSVSDPTVTLTPLQSGIGTLTFEAACSPSVGDLRLGCLYELADRFSSTVQLTGGSRYAPARSRRPVLVASHEHFERLAIDLRQSRTLRRLAVYAFSESRGPLDWGGTLVVTTAGGAKVELPLDPLQGGDVAVLMSLYNVRGEFVLRAEMQALNGGPREAGRAYGYDRITWLDDRTTVD